MAIEQKKKKRNILQKIITGAGEAAGSYIHEKFGSGERERQRGVTAGNQGAEIYTKKIPANIPPAVRQTAVKKIGEMAQSGNYAGIRKYLKGLSN